MNAGLSTQWKWVLAAAPLLAYGFWLATVVVPQVVRIVVPGVVRAVLK